MWVRVPVRWVVLWSLWAARLVRQPAPPRRIPAGLVQGSVAPDGSHELYYGIPYATVRPEDRFQGPRPVPKWNGVFNADNEHIRCMQRFTSNRILGEEDCLTLNVYTPLTRDAPLPVMVFIHGGGFRDGSGTPFIYGPEYLVRHGVVLVTFNYRLEVLGFLCLGTNEAPGNAGLKDQVEALRWVKRNIKEFGGDPDNVTVFGESAGSASVLYHLLSPMSKGLFHKAIMQSGSAMSPWSLQFEPLKTASLLAQQTGHNTLDPYQLYKLFKNMTAEELLKLRVPRKEGDIVLSENIFVPCIEKKLPGIEPFLTDTPYNLLTKGEYNKVPLIIGHNSAEGYMFAGKENDSTILTLDFTKALPRDLKFPSVRVKTETALKFKKLYMGSEEISKTTMATFSRYEGDSSITYPVIATTHLLLKTSDKPTYTYIFSYSGWMNFAKFMYGFMGYPGATHADELFYMFKIRVTLPLMFFESEFVNKITLMWTNFAKYGNPTPESSPTLPSRWEPATEENPQSLRIDNICSMVPVWDDGHIRLWNATYFKYRRTSS